MIPRSIYRRTVFATALFAAFCAPHFPGTASATDRERPRAESPSATLRLALLPAKGLGYTETLAVEHRKRGIAHAGHGRYDLAIEEYTASLKLDPDQSDTYFKRGFAFTQRGLYKRAAEDYSEAIRLRPETTHSNGQPAGDSNTDLKDPYLASIYNNRAFANYRMGFYDWAIEDVTAATHLQPNFVLAYNNRGVFYATKGEFGRAVEDYDKAVDLQPRFEPAYSNRGQAQFFLGRFEDAARDFQQGLSLNPTDATTQAWLYLALERSGQDGKKGLAQQVPSLDLKRWPGPILAIFLGQSTPEQVMEGVKRVEGRERSEKECEAAFYFGQYYLLRGRLQEAERLFREALAFGFSSFIEHIGAKVELQRMGR